MTDTTQNMPSNEAKRSEEVLNESSAAGWITALLLLGILFHLVYLTKDLGIRADLTEEGLYSLTPSTQKVLDGLEEPLIIEAYFSADVPGYFKADRDRIVNMLDEYEQMGGGKVKVAFFDPSEDERIREKANNLGIRENDVQIAEDFGISVKKLWQGLRLRYGGDRQKVLPLVNRSDALESELTPKIREMVLNEKPKIAIVERKFEGSRSMFQTQQQEPGFQLIQRGLGDRFEMVSVNLGDGNLLPDDLDVLVLIQPVNMTDWEKYVIDQHVMRGGHVIVFQDLADYTIDMFNSFTRKKGDVDAQGSALPWKEHLSSYGIKLGDDFVADWATRQQALLVVRGQGGMAALQQAQMPYWFRAQQVDWSKMGNPNAPEFDEKLWSSFSPGISEDNVVLAETQQLDFFWACEVGLMDKLPEGVSGEILVRSSPVSVATSPMPASNPLQEGFVQGVYEQVQKAPRQQFPLMAFVKGKFPSAFAERELPQRPEQQPAGGPGGMPPGMRGMPPGMIPGMNRNGGLQEQPTATPKPDAQQGEEPKPAEGEEPKPAEGEEPKPAEGEGKPAEGAAMPGPAVPGTEAEAPAEEEDENKLPEKIKLGTAESRILVVGDASFIRDDFLQGIGQLRQPRSTQGYPFFQNILDWFALDTDLIELRNRRQTDRSLKLGEQDVDNGESLAAFKERIASKKRWILGVNTLLPVLVLVLFGVLVWFQRSSAKNRFLDQIERQG
jgi:ABC-type uncharacterized transport system involved in gliding motility auxiliary subunit